eukprot:TRINITY_DN54580_c0_g1_i1.p1 TRINITY_DN54580_c0_g1~~TRINITY_DN54580_c0_g1_i1.p1  ORF type:complete len:400 (+),score=86.58 TRINITY_DN54580_c0_g1_i1:169-1368(+)
MCIRDRYQRRVRGAAIRSMASIVVTNVDLNITEMQLRELFGTMGPIVTATPLGQVAGAGVLSYMLTFLNAPDAEKAVLLNGTQLGSRQMQVALVPGGETSDGAAPAPAAAAAPAQPAVPAAAPSPVPGAPPMMQQPVQNLAAAATAGAAAAAAAAPINSGGGSKFEVLPNGMKVLIPDSIKLPDGMNRDPRSEEIARTIYVGNLTMAITPEQVMQFFKVCGPVRYCRMAGTDTPGAESRHAFVEFYDKAPAGAALVLNNQVIGERMIKVGMAQNAIIKPQKTAQEQRKLDEAMRKVKAAQARMSKKFQSPSRKSSSRRSRSRDRDKRRSRDRDKRRRRSRSSDRRRDRSSERGRRRDKDKDKEKENKTEEPEKTDAKEDKAAAEDAEEPDYAAMLEEFE